MTKIGIFGTGYVGLVTGATLASIGHTVECFDVSAEKIESLLLGRIPFFEPGLKELTDSAVNSGKLTFKLVSDINELDHDVHYLAVGTPEAKDGSANLKYIYSALDTIIKYATTDCLIVTKSTVPVGTNRAIFDYVSGSNVFILSNPEFLREGSAVSDSLNPDRIVIGSNCKMASEKLRGVYRSFESKTEILEVSWEEAELTKYSANAFLAAKISFMNEIARICDAFNANIHNVKAGMVLDPRINDSFMNAGCGYGGSCFPKDVLALDFSARSKGIFTKLLLSIDETNEYQKTYLLEKFLKEHSIGGCKVGILGLAFKPDTDDIREAPALAIVKRLLQEDVHLKLYDPEASSNFLAALGEVEPGKLQLANSLDEATDDANVIIVCTEWAEVVNAEIKISKLEKLKFVLDGRNIWSRELFSKAGKVYVGVGT